MWQQNQEQWFKKWKAHAVEFTNSVTYKCIQFITNIEDIEYGSVIQKLTCEDCGMEPQYQEAFWEKYGQDAVHEAIRRKRTTLNNALKRIFKKECESPMNARLPPNPYDFLDSNLLIPIHAVGETDPEDSNSMPEEEYAFDMYLRSSVTPVAQKEYARFLALFTKGLMNERSWNKRTYDSQLKDFLDVSLEAFGVTLYVSNYKKWKTELWKRGDGESTITNSATSSNSTSIRTFTENAQGSGKWGGWSDEGLSFYNNVLKILRVQRERDDCNDFEKMVKQMMNPNKGKKRSRDGEVKAMNNLGNLANIARNL